MLIIENNLIPFRGFLCINLFGIFFVRKDSWARTSDTYKEETYVHETIHTQQMKELLYVFFYIIYFFEWVARLFINGRKAYENISFEKEAFAHQKDKEYLKHRKHYAMWRKQK